MEEFHDCSWRKGEFSSLRTSWMKLSGKCSWKENSNKAHGTFQFMLLSLCGVGIAGVYVAGLCSSMLDRGVRVWSRGVDVSPWGVRVSPRAVLQVLGAPSQVLQTLKEGSFGTFLVHGVGSFFLDLSDLCKRHGLCLKSRLPGPPWPAFSSGGRFGHGQLLRELLQH